VVSTFGDPGPTEFFPREGLYFAVLTAGQGGTCTTLDQQVSVAAGTTISGWAFFRTREDSRRSDFANDDGEVAIQSGGADLAIVFSDDAKTVGPYDPTVIGLAGQTPWTRWSYTFPSAGTYTIEARVRNAVASGRWCR